MGRMTDARKRARRGAGVGAETSEAPAGQTSEAQAADAAPAPTDAVETVAEPPAEPAAADPPSQAPVDFVFPAEASDGGGAEPEAGEKLSLPSSGLAEDILPRVRAIVTPHVERAVRIDLPASGLAEDILARHADSVSAEPAAEAAPAATTQPAHSPAIPGAHSLAFFAAPAQERRVAAEATEHLATFYLEREEYGIDVRQVQEIRRVTEITTVPRAPQFIRGVINLRGRILPVLDLRCKLGLGRVDDNKAARIVVVRVQERIIGLLVDGASQVLKVPVSRIEPAPEEVVEKGGDYIRGVAKLDDRLIILVELERLLAHELRATGAANSPAES